MGRFWAFSWVSQVLLGMVIFEISFCFQALVGIHPLIFPFEAINAHFRAWRLLESLLRFEGIAVRDRECLLLEVSDW